MNITIPTPSFASWKTTLAGLISLFLGAMQAYSLHDWGAAIKDPRVQTAVLLGILGMLAKDSNVTGGTTGQPSTPKALADANQAPSPLNPPLGLPPAKL
jgi:hypothetical protein